MGLVHDVRQCVTMDLKEPGNDLYVVGLTKDELGGSHFNVVTKQTGGNVPRVDLELAPRIFAAVHSAIMQGLLRACHDTSEGGLAVALAEMAFAGGVGADLTTFKDVASGVDDTVRLFSESASRVVLEVKPKARHRGIRGIAADENRRDRKRTSPADRRREWRMVDLGEAG